MVSASGSGAIAVLIDAENVAPEQVELVLHWFRSWKGTLIKRAYGNWFRLPKWEPFLIQHDIEPIHALPVSPGKNAADIRLTVDAVDLLHKRQVRQFCIVTSDGDFVPLARYLKQEGAKVLGVGKQSASAALKTAYYQFASFDQLNPTAAVTEPVVPLPEAKPEATAATVSSKPYAQELQNLAQQCFQTLAPSRGWLTIARFNAYLSTACTKELGKPFSCKLFGYSNMTQLIDGLSLFEWKPGQGVSAGHGREFRLKR